jgi:YD repeat-containing protein
MLYKKEKYQQGGYLTNKTSYVDEQGNTIVVTYDQNGNKVVNKVPSGQGNKLAVKTTEYMTGPSRIDSLERQLPVRTSGLLYKKTIEPLEQPKVKGMQDGGMIPGQRFMNRWTQGVSYPTPLETTDDGASGFDPITGQPIVSTNQGIITTKHGGTYAMGKESSLGDMRRGIRRADRNAAKYSDSLRAAF